MTVRRNAWRDRVVLGVVCLLLTVVHTWPLARAPHRYSRVDNADYLLNAWAISWVAHQVVTDPTRLFDANIFWPGRRTLAYSEAMLVQSAIAAPVRWLGGSPVLAYNVAMLSGFFLTAFAFGLLLYRWTGSLAASVVTASAAAFNAHLVTRLAHLQAMHLEFLAVALYALDRVFGRQRLGDAVTLGIAFALQGLTSVYLMTFTTWAMIFAGAVRLVVAPSARRRRAIVLSAVAACVALVALSFYLYAYYGLHADQGFARTALDNRTLAGSYADYLSTVSRLHYWWSARFFEMSRSTNFPGLTVMALAAVALCTATTRKDPRVQMSVAIAAGCAVVGVLPRLPGYDTIHGFVPLFWAVRVQAHIGQIVLVALAILAGFGTARLAAAWRAPWPSVAAASLLVVLINAESIRAPLALRTYEGIPAVYAILKGERAAVVVELPMFDRRGIFRNAWYQLYSTAHWQPLVNGYSGFIPRHYYEIFEDARGFPDGAALQALHARGITHVVVHRKAFIEQFGFERFDAVVNAESLLELAHDDDISIYRLR